MTLIDLILPRPKNMCSLGPENVLFMHPMKIRLDIIRKFLISLDLGAFLHIPNKVRCPTRSCPAMPSIHMITYFLLEWVLTMLPIVSSNVGPLHPRHDVYCLFYACSSYADD